MQKFTASVSGVLSNKDELSIELCANPFGGPPVAQQTGRPESGQQK